MSDHKLHTDTIIFVEGEDKLWNSFHKYACGDYSHVSRCSEWEAMSRPDMDDLAKTLPHFGFLVERQPYIPETC